MNFIKRAWLFTKAKISRTILLIVAFTAILLFVVSGLVINSAANKSIENAQKSTGATVTLSVDRQKQFDAMRKQMQSQGANAGFQPAKIQQTPVELSQAEKIASLSDVKSYLFQTSASVTKSTGITPITSTDNNSDNQGFGGRVAMMGGQDLASADFRLTGVNATAVYTDFTDGTSTMVSGRGITDEDKGTNNVVIEQSLATSNNLTVGSSFKIKDGNSKEQTMKVVGIYKTTASATGMDAQINAMNPSNNIFVYYATATSLSASGKAGTIDSAVYNLNDPGQMSQFVKTASADVDTNTFALTTNDALYQQMLQPLHNVASFAKNIIILVSIAGAVILALIVMLMVRERRFEIGVLMSLGESKFKIIGQFFVELFIVMIVSVGLASAAGGLVGNAVGQQLLNQQTEQVQSNNQQQGGGPQMIQGGQGQGGGQFRTGGNHGGGFMRGMGIGQSSKQMKAINNLNIKMTGQQIALLTGIAILITLVAVGLASIGILRLNPKEVLTN